MKKLCLIFLGLFTFTARAQNSDTIINGHHYNTIIWYTADGFRSDSPAQVIAFGNMKDSVPHGRWIYATAKGKVLAQGKYRKGYKVRDWYYLQNGSYVNILWSRSSRAVSSICFENNRPFVVDYNAKDKNILFVSGRRPIREFPIRFL